MEEGQSQSPVCLYGLIYHYKRGFNIEFQGTCVIFIDVSGANAEKGLGENRKQSSSLFYFEIPHKISFEKRVLVLK